MDEKLKQTGVLISISGIDGGGKSTLIQRLADMFSQRGLQVYQTKQPTPVYREHPAVEKMHQTGETDLSFEALALLSAFDRLIHAESIGIGRQHYDFILTDRYLLDGIVSFTARGIDREWVETINQFCPQPDIGFLVDCPGAVAYERIITRGGRMTDDEKSVNYLEKKRQLFLDCRTADTVVLNGTDEAERVFQAALDVINERLKF